MTEMNLLKAKLHLMERLDVMKTEELFKSNMLMRKARLHEQGIKLEREFQEDEGTDKKFDWNTLSFPKE